MHSIDWWPKLVFRMNYFNGVLDEFANENSLKHLFLDQITKEFNKLVTLMRFSESVTLIY